MSINVTFIDLAERSTSWNGYEREAAIKGLLTLKDPRAIPLLIKRTNDWVLPVKQLAQQALIAFMEYRPANFVPYLPQIISLGQKRRWDHTELVDSVTQKIVALAPNELLSAITSCDSKLAMVALKLCFDHSVATADQLMTAAISNRQLHNAHYLITLIEQLDDVQFAAHEDDLLGVCYLPLKNKVIKRLNEINPDKVALIAETLMCNQDGAIRLIGRKHLQLTPEGAIDYYQSILDNQTSSLNQRIIATIELTALKKMDALGTIKFLLKDKAPKMRKCALQQLASLQGEAAKAILAEGLADSHNSVTREAARLCRQIGVLFSEEEILSLAAIIDRERTLDSLLLVSKLQERWTRLKLYLKLLNLYKDETATTTYIRHALDGWWRAISQGSGYIPKAQLVQLNELALMNKNLLPNYQYAELRFMLDTSN